jgi:hypothetical protein
MHLFGKIIEPPIKNASKVEVWLSPDPQMDDHWTEKPTIVSPKSVGVMIVRRDKTLDLYCRLPTHSFAFVCAAVGKEKIKHIRVYGERLRWGKGGIINISFSTTNEEE